MWLQVGTVHFSHALTHLVADWLPDHGNSNVVSHLFSHAIAQPLAFHLTLHQPHHSNSNVVSELIPFAVSLNRISFAVSQPLAFHLTLYLSELIPFAITVAISQPLTFHLTDIRSLHVTKHVPFAGA